MTGKMPRGAFPVRRSELVGSESYQPGVGAELFVPSGEFPTPNHELAAAPPYRGMGAAPESFIAWPIAMDRGWNEQIGNSTWAEEAFAKACAEPKVLIPADVVQVTSRECGVSNFAEFMRTRGFHWENKVYLDGAFNSVDWTNSEALNGAIARVGPVKVGVASAILTADPAFHVTPGTNGWAIHGLPAGHPEDHIASVFGYGPSAALVQLFESHGAAVKLPPGMPTGLCYAMFIWGSVGILDHQSLIHLTGEAWCRNPTTIVRSLSG